MMVGRNTLALISILIFLKCITYSWSHSASPYERHLYKRESELFEEKSKCDNIHLQEDQCAFVLQHCAHATPGFINYIQWYYCSSVKPLVFVFMCCWLLFLFGFVGIAASDFFCPNLQTIASALHLSESLTGVTFLAFGNGSPDLFSTFSAMQSNLGSLALGELIGAASFIVSVVAGFMCAIKPFRAKKFSFIRDVSFFTLAILLVMTIVADGFIYLHEAILLILFYIAYVLVVVVGNYIMKKRSNYLNLVERARMEYEENGTDVDILLRGNMFMAGNEAENDEMQLYDEGFEMEGYQDISHPRRKLHPRLRIRSSLFSAIEFQDVVQSLKSNSLRYNALSPRQQEEHSEHRGNQRLAHYEHYTDDVSLHTTESTHPVIFSASSSQAPTFLKQVMLRLRSLASDPYCRREISTRLFPSLIRLRQKSIFSKISSIFSAPVTFLLTITLPVVRENMLKTPHLELNEQTDDLLRGYDESDQDDNDMLGGEEGLDTENGGWVKWLTALQLVGAPILISIVLVTQDIISASKGYPLALLLGAVLSSLFWLTTRQWTQPRLYWMMCFIGFMMAMVWIFLIANEVVSVLQAIGMAVGISEAILGLTIFALGNSLGDFVANVTMAKMGYPLMAMSACFGGPMLNIMLGVGIGATYVTSQRNEPYAIDVSKSIVVSSIGLLVVLISFLVLVPLNGFKMSRGFGYGSILIYLLCTAINLYLEIHS
ncbi:Sodium/calcium exchanger protein-domain-containing protein [Mycotypha africana]|uniref:Sodium/calcium exchanger protein-domain-containing protein n=1 Tax=Mycotypha africana TaxID=64632 RepID=UPI0023004BBB|nr:Sodium/calcium exchanger protein-domain-containing protein [Mycotypha africana]KAI8972002.1 Sodium/calcium exchanger protein-domain-containing protein [Mycotypha africana]